MCTTFNYLRLLTTWDAKEEKTIEWLFFHLIYHKSERRPSASERGMLRMAKDAKKKGSRHFNRKISVISVTWLCCPPFVVLILFIIGWTTSSVRHFWSLSSRSFCCVQIRSIFFYYCARMMFLLCIIIFRFSASENHKNSQIAFFSCEQLNGDCWWWTG